MSSWRSCAAARHALEAAGIQVLAERDVLVQRLNQAEAGHTIAAPDEESASRQHQPG